MTTTVHKNKPWQFGVKTARPFHISDQQCYDRYRKYLQILFTALLDKSNCSLLLIYVFFLLFILDLFLDFAFSFRLDLFGPAPLAGILWSLDEISLFTFLIISVEMFLDIFSICRTCLCNCLT